MDHFIYRAKTTLNRAYVLGNIGVYPQGSFIGQRGPVKTPNAARVYNGDQSMRTSLLYDGFEPVKVFVSLAPDVEKSKARRVFGRTQ